MYLDPTSIEKTAPRASWRKKMAVSGPERGVIVLGEGMQGQLGALTGSGKLDRGVGTECILLPFLVATPPPNPRSYASMPARALSLFTVSPLMISRLGADRNTHII